MAERGAVRRTRARRRPRTRPCALVALPLTVLLLAGCAASPRAELRDLVADTIAAANDGDADAVRRAAQALISEVQSQQAGGDIGDTEANALLDLARQVQADAALLEQAPPPPPSPTASPTPSPTPSSPSPTPSRSPSPSPSPSPTQEPEPSEEAEPSEAPPPSSPAPIVSISPVASASPSPSASPAQAGRPAKPGKKSPSASPGAAR